MPHVITEPGAVDTEWLTGVLRRCRAGWAGHVTAVEVEAERSLPYSRTARLKIRYSEPPPGPLPKHLFLKLSPVPSDGEKPPENGSEIDFYRTVASEMNAPPLARCYDAEFSDQLGSSHLLLEDLSASHFQTQQAKHPSPLHSELAVKCLARFHAHWWEHPKIGKEIGKVFDKRWLDSFLIDLEVSVVKFLEFRGDSLSTEQRHAYDLMLRSSRPIWGRLTDAAGLTVTHGDTHWWNFFHANDPGIEETRIIDWQLWHIDQGPRDLAFLIALGGFAERRPELEAHLIDTYYKTLIECGVRNYSRVDFWQDYRRSAIRNLNIPVIFWSQGKHPTTWQGALERAFQSYNELKCCELL